MTYYYLQDEDVLQEGDEWQENEGWNRCFYSIGYTVATYRAYLENSEWQARRPTKTTKLGNCL